MEDNWRQAYEDRIYEIKQGEENMVRRLVDNEFFAGQQAYGSQQIYRGQMSGQLQELQLVQAWRLMPDGQWALQKAVVHRVHNDMAPGRVTVQFLSDQHRHILPQTSVKPIPEITPVYPKIRLEPGERVPTRDEIEQRERKADNMRKAMAVPSDAPLPGTDMGEDLRPGEYMMNGRPTIKADRWGIPGPTLEALRNRGLPTCQVRGEYGQHYYTNLYRGYCEPQAGTRLVSASGTIGVDSGKYGGHVMGHRFVPVSGPELEQDLRTGDWRLAPEEAAAIEEKVPQSEPWILG